MPVVVTCNCGKSYHAPETLQGKRVKCPACGGVVTVPMAAASPSPQRTNVAPAPATPNAAHDPLGLGGLAAGPAYGAPGYGAPGYGAPNQAGRPAAPSPYGGFGGGAPASYGAPAGYPAPSNYAPAGYAPRPASSGGFSALKILLLIGGVGGVALIAIVVLVALLIPAVAAARKAAREAQARNEQRAMASGASGPGIPGGIPANSPGGVAGGASSSGGAWRTHTGSGYSVEFPGTPQRKTKTQASPVGVMTTHIDQVADKDGAYQVGVTEMPLSNEQYEALMTSGLETALDEGITGMMRAVGNAQVTSQGPFSIGTFRGREVQFDASLFGKQAAGYGRVLMVNKKVIEVLWLGERNLKGSADVKRFINSLQVTETPLPVTGGGLNAGGPGAGMPPGTGGPGAPGVAAPPGTFGGPGGANIGGPPGTVSPPNAFPGGAPSGFPGSPAGTVGGNPAFPGAPIPGAPGFPGGAGGPGFPGGPSFPGGPGTSPRGPNGPGGPGFPGPGVPRPGVPRR